MSQPKSQWSNKKYPHAVYTGMYTRDANNERVFLLFCFYPKKNKMHHVTFESAHAAKALGWIKG